MYSWKRNNKQDRRLELMASHHPERGSPVQVPPHANGCLPLPRRQSQPSTRHGPVPVGARRRPMGTGVTPRHIQHPPQSAGRALAATAARPSASVVPPLAGCLPVRRRVWTTHSWRSDPRGSSRRRGCLWLAGGGQRGWPGPPATSREDGTLCRRGACRQRKVGPNPGGRRAAPPRPVRLATRRAFEKSVSVLLV